MHKTLEFKRRDRYACNVLAELELCEAFGRECFGRLPLNSILQRFPATVILQGEQQERRPLRKRVAAAFLRLAVRVYKALQFKRRNRYVNVVAMT